MTNLKENELYYQGLLVRRQPETDLICLTDIWRAQCAPAKHRPLAWMRLDSTQSLLKQFIQQTGDRPVWSTHRRKNHPSEPIITEVVGMIETVHTAGDLLTFASPQLALVYAKFLAVECYEWALMTLIGESEEVALCVEQIEQKAASQAGKQFSRRALLAAGWATPVILTVGLHQRALARISTYSSGNSSGSNTKNTINASIGPAGTEGDGEYSSNGSATADSSNNAEESTSSAGSDETIRPQNPTSATIL